MKIKHDDIIIGTENPFENCQLERLQYADILTTIINKYADGFVLAINGEWGTGKTTFVKMWQQQLKNNGYQTLYFNAWENDFELNPLVALMAELKTLTNQKTTLQFKSLVKKGAVITKNVLPQLIKAIAEKHIDTKTLVDALENSTKGVTEILESEINEYASRKQSIRDFKEILSKFVQSTKCDNPIVFIVDELDRCRPNYAVEVLEQIKHFFSVPGIVFVLSIDKVQLGHAIRGVYGSDRINADEYLRRFIDLEYSIPEPNTESFVRYLYKYFSYDSFLHSDARKDYRDFKEDRNELIKTSSFLFEKSNISLRQQEKVFAHARIGLHSFQSNQYIFPSLYFFLTYLKNFNISLYQKIKQKKLSFEDLTLEFSNTVSKGITEEHRRYLIHLEALLVFMYHNYIYDYRASLPLIKKENESGEEKATVKSRLDTSQNQSDFLYYIRQYLNKFNGRSISVEYLLKRIDLIDNLIS